MARNAIVATGLSQFAQNSISVPPFGAWLALAAATTMPAGPSMVARPDGRSYRWPPNNLVTR